VLQKRNAQRTPKTTKGRVSSSNFITPDVSFVAALQDRAEQQQQ
jgi:hypothetical protein